MYRMPETTQADQQAFTDQCFAAWMAKVDRFLESKVGLSSADLSDVCYREMFDDGESPAHAGRAAIRATKGDE